MHSDNSRISSRHFPSSPFFHAMHCCILALRGRQMVLGSTRVPSKVLSWVRCRERQDSRVMARPSQLRPEARFSCKQFRYALVSLRHVAMTTNRVKTSIFFVFQLFCFRRLPAYLVSSWGKRNTQINSRRFAPKISPQRVRTGPFSRVVPYF